MSLRNVPQPLPAKAVAHPRSAGCFARILGRHVRDGKKLSLPVAIHRCALRPAQILEASVPQMKNKGRPKVGADADVIVFDPKTVRDRATYLERNQTSVGMRSVLTSGGAGTFRFPTGYAITCISRSLACARAGRFLRTEIWSSPWPSADFGMAPVGRS